MAALSNPRWERFAQELAKGSSLDDAYRLAGYSPARQNAHRLMTNDDVRKRVAEIQERGAVRSEVTVASLIAEAEEVRQRALDAGQFAPAIAAIKEKGILSGMRIEKQERKTVADLQRLTDAELEAIIAAGSQSTPPGGLTH
ncbi:terminase small subunit [Azorhizobium doebereinerae]|uniref:terminase small subunit n=1 Tax=Azorhizobium doebereinerae TaxID=281091 RepID=UPI000687F897|nr:terminase small subunit [Azorhizobium doebereinerae]